VLKLIGVFTWRIWLPHLDLGDAAAHDRGLAERRDADDTGAGPGLHDADQQPEDAIVYASVFAPFCPARSRSHSTSRSSCWSSGRSRVVRAVALALASERPRSVYLRYKAWMIGSPVES